MSKAQRKRNRKIRNTQNNWGRIEREQREQSRNRVLKGRNYSPRHPSIASNPEFLELLNG